MGLGSWKKTRQVRLLIRSLGSHRLSQAVEQRMRRSVTRRDPGVNIQKTVETQWFRQENHLRLVGFPHLCQRLQEGRP